MEQKTKKRIAIAIGVTAVLGIAAYFGVKCYNERRNSNPHSGSDGTLKRILGTCGHGITNAERKENEAEIRGALKGHDVDVKYYPPTTDGECGHYRVEAKDGADLDVVVWILEGVAKSLGMEIDDEAYNIKDLVDRGDTKK